MCDMAHFSGLVAAGLHPSPVPHCDFVTSTSHKTLAGPRAGFVLCREEHASKLDRANFPGHAGRPADARDRREGRVLPDRDDRRVQGLPGAGPRERRHARRDAAWPAATTSSPAAPTRTSSSSICARTEWTGLAAQERLEECRLTANRNTVPFDERPPMVASGVRLGTPAATMRGFDEDDFREVGVDHRRARSTRARASTTCAPARSRSATSGRSTRASAATPRT